MSIKSALQLQQEIYNILANESSPISVYTLMARLDNKPRVTVLDNLAVLIQQGKVEKRDPIPISRGRPMTSFCVREMCR